MIGQQPMARGWAVAAALSLAVHGAAAGAFLWRPALPWQEPAPAPAQIQVSALPLPTLAPETEVLRPITAPVPPEPDTETEPTLAPAVPQGASPVLTSNALPTGREAAPPQPEPQPEAGAETGPDADPRLVALFQRIRSQLTAPCLLALPALDAEGRIRLNLLAADDAQIPGLLRGLTQGLETGIDGQAVLLDRRQCPALAFARRDPRYPVFPLGINLQSQDVASGASLRGTISGGAGRQVTLLLIDDNGVTHDLRRFMVSAGGQIRFDLPIARDGAGRDTHQLLLAVATPARPASVSAGAGELAETFFERLAREVGPEALVGVSSVYVRAKS
ncbi:hypothetical protein [Paracoccus sp. DMF]|uniref:hypothetical protein n=1 Tax=Paracoccus sp. DMF TaxID=400837 RepID=UPI0021E374CA|nr:hypothetical protein [Paracoccus sp. DMF]MCV2445800.1 hypothetical protein [Paracoccus sp. DMF]